MLKSMLSFINRESEKFEAAKDKGMPSEGDSLYLMIDFPDGWKPKIVTRGNVIAHPYEVRPGLQLRIRCGPDWDPESLWHFREGLKELMADLDATIERLGVKGAAGG